jgi:hypothetical protein
MVSFDPVEQNNNKLFEGNFMARIVSCSEFTQFLVDQQPVYDKYIIKDIRPYDGGDWISHVSSGTFEAWSGTQHTRDRFNSVFPNVTKQWLPTTSAGCLGTPCDKDEHMIGWGSTRLTYGLEEQSWATQLLCYDQEMHITAAREQFGYIISKILKPATTAIQSNFLRKRGAQFADTKYIANRSFGSAAAAFTFAWVVTNTNEERYIDTNANPNNVFKLTPQMLQRLVEPLMRVGYLGEMPFKEEKNPPMLELVTDNQTIWELDRLGGQQGVGTGNNPNVTSNWRFTEWDAASKYWRYGFSGTIGNFVARVDTQGLRFNYVGVVGGNFRYQVVLPYYNITAGGAGSQAGIKSIPNPDFDNAQFAFSYVWHQKGIEVLVADAQPVNPEMPFAARNFGGKWQFVMDNLGADVNGCVIENKRRNKGQFIADFKQAIAPNYTEFLVLIFHKREPMCVLEINTCNADPGYPTQTYSSAPPNCADDHSGTSPVPGNTTLTFTPTINSSLGYYWVEANSAICEGSPIQHQALTGAATLAALVIQLNTYLNVLGTWAVSSATQISFQTTPSEGILLCPCRRSLRSYNPLDCGT